MPPTSTRRALPMKAFYPTLPEEKRFLTPFLLGEQTRTRDNATDATAAQRSKNERQLRIIPLYILPECPAHKKNYDRLVGERIYAYRHSACSVRRPLTARLYA